MIPRMLAMFFALLLVFPACDDTSGPKKPVSEQCVRDVLNLRGWLKELTEKTYESPVSVRSSISLLVANIENADRPTSSRPLIEIGKKKIWVENHLARPVQLKDLLEKTATQAKNLSRGDSKKKLPCLLLAIDRDAPWSRVVRVHDVAAQTGFSQLAILYTPYGQKTTARPGPSNIDVELDTIHKMSDPVEKVTRLAKLIRRVCADCPELDSVFKSLSVTNPEAKARVIVRFLPDALSECGCAVDLPSLRAILWTMLEHTSMIAALFEISESPLAKEKVIRQPLDTPWHEVNVYIRSLVRPGMPRRVRFAAP